MMNKFLLRFNKVRGGNNIVRERERKIIIRETCLREYFELFAKKLRIFENLLSYN